MKWGPKMPSSEAFDEKRENLSRLGDTGAYDSKGDVVDRDVESY